MQIADQLYGDGVMASDFGELAAWHDTLYTLRVKPLTETATIPTRAHYNDAGIDLYADEDIVLLYGGIIKVRTGISIAIPPGYYGDIRSRSSYWARGILATGTVDSDYRGEVFVVLGWPCLPIDSSDYTLIKGTLPLRIKRGDKIAQMVITLIGLDNIVIVDSLEDTKRGDSGFGSTGNTSRQH